MHIGIDIVDIVDSAMDIGVFGIDIDIAAVVVVVAFEVAVDTVDNIIVAVDVVGLFLVVCIHIHVQPYTHIHVYIYIPPPIWLHLVLYSDLYHPYYYYFYFLLSVGFAAHFSHLSSSTTPYSSPHSLICLVVSVSQTYSYLAAVLSSSYSPIPPILYCPSLHCFDYFLYAHPGPA